MGKQKQVKAPPLEESIAEVVRILQVSYQFPARKFEDLRDALYRQPIEERAELLRYVIGLAAVPSNRERNERSCSMNEKEMKAIWAEVIALSGTGLISNDYFSEGFSACQVARHLRQQLDCVGKKLGKKAQSLFLAAILESPLVPYADVVLRGRSLPLIDKKAKRMDDDEIYRLIFLEDKKEAKIFAEHPELFMQLSSLLTQRNADLNTTSSWLMEQVPAGEVARVLIRYALTFMSIQAQKEEALTAVIMNEIFCADQPEVARQPRTPRRGDFSATNLRNGEGVDWELSGGIMYGVPESCLKKGGH